MRRNETIEERLDKAVQAAMEISEGGTVDVKLDLVAVHITEGRSLYAAEKRISALLLLVMAEQGLASVVSTAMFEVSLRKEVLTRDETMSRARMSAANVEGRLDQVAALLSEARTRRSAGDRPGSLMGFILALHELSRALFLVSDGVDLAQFDRPEGLQRTIDERLDEAVRFKVEDGEGKLDRMVGQVIEAGALFEYGKRLEALLLLVSAGASLASVVSTFSIELAGSGEALALDSGGVAMRDGGATVEGRLDGVVDLTTAGRRLRMDGERPAALTRFILALQGLSTALFGISRSLVDSWNGKGE